MKRVVKAIGRSIAWLFKTIFKTHAKQTIRSLGIALIAAICVVIFILGFFGVTTKYGDVTTTVVKSHESVRYDIDMAKSLKFIYTPVDEDFVPTKEEVDKAREVFEKRLEKTGIETYDLYSDYTTGALELTLPYDIGDSFGLGYFVDNLGATSEFYASTFDSFDASNTPYIFSDKNVTSAKVDFRYLFGNTLQSTVTITLDSEGRKDLKTSTKALMEAKADTGDAQVINFWFNGNRIGTASITETIGTGRITLNSYELDEGGVRMLSMHLNSGQLPYEMEYTASSSNVIEYSAAMGETPSKTVGIALMCAFAAIFLFAIARYGVVGFSGAVSALGASGIIMYFITGFFTGIGAGIVGSLASLAAFALVLFIIIETAMRDGAAIKSLLADPANGVDKAVSVGLRSTVWKTVRVYFVMLIVAVLTVLCGRVGTIASALKLIGLPNTGITALGAFGAVMLPGMLALLLFAILTQRALIALFVGVTKNPVLYGGARK